jgi:hypothetical protein
MTEKCLKKLLQDFIAMQEKEILLKPHPEVLNSPDWKNQGFQIKVLKSAMSILTKKENFIIESHLILHNTWPETYDLFEERYGSKNSCSDRTLKRIQNKALKKMLDFINSLSVKNCSNDKRPKLFMMIE